MNNNLNKLIEKYNESFDFVNNSEHAEYFKWQAVQCFQREWFSKENEQLTFDKLLKAALSESAVLIDNSTTHPANGAIKLAEIEPEKVEHLFRNLLFADDGGDLNARQDNIYQFMEDMEEIRKAEFPESWKYKQDDKHAAITYLALYKPEENYIYKYSVAEKFANYIEFGLDIGSGGSFSLSNYYKMCDEVVAALSEYPDLVKRHADFIDDTCYKDESLHLLAFDIIYCASTYNFFNGMTHQPKKDVLKAYKLERLAEAERREKEVKIAELLQKKEILENEIADTKEMSLLGVKVLHKANGEGIIVQQDDSQRSKVQVEFAEKTISLVIDRKFRMRPTFEDDEEIVEMYTRYNEVWDEIKKTDKKIKAIGVV